MKGLLVAVGGVVVLTAVSGEVSFTGAVSLDLAEGANWEGGLPTASDVAVVDMGKFPSAAYTVSKPVAFGGIVFNNAPQESSLSGEALTLGADGLKFNPASGTTAPVTLQVTAPLGTSAAQTWDFTTAKYVFWTNLVGTAELSIKTGYGLHMCPPAYGGKLRYVKFTPSLRFYEPGKIAEEVTAEVNQRFELEFTNSVAFSTLFPSRTFNSGCTMFWTQRAGDFGFKNENGYGTLDLRSGDTWTFNAGFLGVDAGTVNQSGGTVNCGSGNLQIGFSLHPSAWNISGGEVSARSFIIGNQCAKDEAQSFTMTGGKATFSTTAFLGHEKGNEAYFADFALKGGEFAVTSDADETCGLHFLAKYVDNPSTTSMRAKLAGGTLSVNQLAAGYPMGPKYYFAQTNGFAVFEMASGLLNLGRWGIRANDSWNALGETNALCRFVFSGGTVKATAGFPVEMPIDLPASSSPSVWDTNGKGVSVSAPVYGEGTLRKTGAGNLILTDATDFKGSVDVREGSLELLGEVGTCAEADCVRWVAADAAADKADGEPVTGWTDANANVAAAWIDVATNVAPPTAAKGVFNGRDGLRFEGSGLYLKDSDNPLANQTNFSVVVVLKPDGVGQGQTTWYQNSGIFGYELPATPNDWGLTYTVNAVLNVGYGMDGASGGAGDFRCLSDAARPLNDGKAHVAIVTWQNGDEYVNVDGYVTSNVLARVPVPAMKRNAKPMYIGFVDPTNPAKYAYKGWIAEIRVYKNRILDAAEQDGLIRQLTLRYSGLDMGVTAFANEDAAALSGDLKAPQPGGAELDDSAVAVWEGDSLAATLADGVAVECWTANDGENVATLEGAVRSGGSEIIGRTAPLFASRSINGHGAVRFDASKSTVLGTSADWPLVGKSSFTISTVFRTTRKDFSDTINFYRAGGIIGNELPNSSRGDFGLGPVRPGTLLCGTGVMGGDKYLKARKPYDISDGKPHCAVFAVDSVARKIRLMVDGVYSESSVDGTQVKAIEAYRVLFGCIDGESPVSSGFTGDVAEIRMYGEALDGAAMRRICESRADKYGCRFLGCMPVRYGEERAFGLGATNLTVASGAKLRLPLSSANPYTLTPDCTFSCAGSVIGSLRVAGAVTLDATAATPESVDDLQFADGARFAFPVDGQPIAVNSVSAVGSLAIDLVGDGEPLPNPVVLFTYADAATFGDVTITVNGSACDYRLVVNERKRRVEAKAPKGLQVIVR